MSASINKIVTPSICIPWMFSTISLGQIQAVFEDLNFGDIEKIDIIKKEDRNGRNYQTVFVHLAWAVDNSHVSRVRDILLAGDEVPIVYDDPWFWKIRASNSSRPEHKTHRPTPSTTPTAPYINFEAITRPRPPLPPGPPPSQSPPSQFS
jgi:hypothetical protein